jgi:hypothetical protein
VDILDEALREMAGTPYEKPIVAVVSQILQLNNQMTDMKALLRKQEEALCELAAKQKERKV